MSLRGNRLLDPKCIPNIIWDASSETLSLPQSLAQAYRTIIDRHGLKDLSERRNSDDPPVGGLTQEQADQHFAQAFDGSAARAELAITDPKNDVTQVSNAFINSLSGNQILVTYAPCGAGASVFAYLSTVAALRESGVLPRVPLDVHLIGAEISDFARNYAEELYADIKPILAEQAIFLEADFCSWDVTNALSNTDLIRRMTLASSDSQKRLLIVANFNAFLERDKKRKEAERQIEELFRHASGANSVAIWIEPNMKRATGSGGLFSWLRKLLEGPWKFFASEHTDGTPVTLTSHARLKLPLKEDSFVRVRLSVMKLDLDRKL
jgi:hypothetical protein